MALYSTQIMSLFAILSSLFWQKRKCDRIYSVIFEFSNLLFKIYNLK